MAERELTAHKVNVLKRGSTAARRNSPAVDRTYDGTAMNNLADLVEQSKRSEGVLTTQPTDPALVQAFGTPVLLLVATGAMAVQLKQWLDDHCLTNEGPFGTLNL
jgi:hypothetical protein